MKLGSLPTKTPTSSWRVSSRETGSQGPGSHGTGSQGTGSQGGAAERWYLDFAGRRLALAPGDLVVGRNPDSDSSSALLPVSDSTVSRHHARLRLADGRLFLADLGSSNGTFVNGRRLRGETELSPGDRLRLGRVRLQVGRGEVAAGAAAIPVPGERLGSGRRRFCPSCGGRVGTEDGVCPHCGEDLTSERPLSRSEAIAMSEVLPVGEALALPPRRAEMSYPLGWGDTEAPPPGDVGDDTTITPRPLDRPDPSLDDTDGDGSTQRERVIVDTADSGDLHDIDALVENAAESDDPRPLFLPAASVPRRLAAALVDGVGLACVGLAGSAVAALAEAGETADSTLLLAGLGAAGGAWLLMSFVGWWRWGTTPGKRLLRLWVCDLDGRPGLSPGRAAVRFLGYLLSIATLGYGFLRVALAADGRALHDHLAGTYVAHPSPNLRLAGGGGQRRFRRRDQGRNRLRSPGSRPAEG